MENGPTVDVDLLMLANGVDSDEDDSGLSCSVMTQPTEGTASSANVTLTFDTGDDLNDLPLGETRYVVVMVQVDDGNGGLTSNKVTLTVTGINDAPTLDAIVGITVADTPVDEVFAPVTGMLSVLDVDAGSTTVGSGGAITEGADTFTYELEGGRTAVVTLDINGLDSDDLITGAVSADLVDSGIGDDTVIGLNGNDTVFGGEGVAFAVCRCGRPWIRRPSSSCAAL